MESTADDPLAILMEKYQGGDESAFSEIYRQTVRGIERYLRRWVDPSRVGDLAQETYLQMHRARRTFRPELPFRPWLYAIARHVALQAIRSHGRKAGREVVDEDLNETLSVSNESQLISRFEVERALATLPEDQKEAFWLSEVEGLTSREISRVTGATEGAIRVRVHRANRKLREWLMASGRPSGGEGTK